MTTTIERAAVTSHPISEVIANRWSPRSFDRTADVREEKLVAMLEAARWSASAANTQPWRFIIGRRGGPIHSQIVEHLMGFNKIWAANAAVLIANLAETTDPEGNPRRWAEYDLGQAVATMTLQAHKDGLHAHQMGGVEADALRDALQIDPHFSVVSVTAIGVLAPPEELADEVLRERETTPRVRKSLDELIFINS